VNILFETHIDFPNKGVFFVDLTPSLLDVKTRDKIIDELFKIYSKSTVDYIVSPDARGYIWGSMVAQKFGVPLIPLRKPGKLPLGAIGATVDFSTEYAKTSLCIPKVELKGKHCLFIDDVYATGGTYRATKTLVAKMGGTVIGASVVLDLKLDNNPEIKAVVKNLG